MKNSYYVIALLVFMPVSMLAQKINYQLDNYADSPGKISVTIRLDKTVQGPVFFSMPRSAPGTYGVALYDRFINGLEAFDTNGKNISVSQEPHGPRWRIGNDSANIQLLHYTISLKEMEANLEAYQSSKIRKDYTSILNYSIFGFIQELESNPISLTINTSPGWKIFSTISPEAENLPQTLTVSVANYAILADGQTVIGSKYDVKRFKDAPVPLYVVLYSETKADIDLIGSVGTYCLNALKNYFDTLPFSHYTIYQEYLIPPRSNKGLVIGLIMNMEHANSMTSFLDTAYAYQPGKDTALVFRMKYNYLHHIGHSWIPIRCYGENYKPFTWGLPPIEDAIWAHEGFIRFACFDILKNPDILKNFKTIVYGADKQINELSMVKLSQLGSTQFSVDLRIGQNIYARGALMAYEIDQFIREKTGNKQSFRDALRHLFRWSQKNARGFSVNELSGILQEGINTDIQPIYKKWLQPLK